MLKLRRTGDLSLVSFLVRVGSNLERKPRLVSVSNFENKLPYFSPKGKKFPQEIRFCITNFYKFWWELSKCISQTMYDR
jgi:hypothetical protein